MALTYFKRYRMELDLRRWGGQPLAPPTGYRLWAWDPGLLSAHADVKYRCFQQELDANIFPCFGSRDGCQRLMQEISQRQGFIPQATWLLSHAGPRGDDFCGTIQGVREAADLASIQNIGIVPEHRGHGLGTVLIHRALAGLRDAGLARVYLEVTAQNDGAVRLYQRLGFAKVRVLYKTQELVECS
jgi:ribosomal protein S18 acetylase RimI-like enzyme